MITSKRTLLAMLCLAAVVSFAGVSAVIAHCGGCEVDKDIVVRATDAGNFTKLVAALEAADLVDTLKGDGPFTVFAPNDDAFADLPDGKLDELLKPENKEDLQDILKFHVVSGRLLAADVTKAETLETLQGDELEVEVKDGKVFVGGAEVTATDLECGNGYIHTIDAVLLP